MQHHHFGRLTGSSVSRFQGFVESCSEFEEWLRMRKLSLDATFLDARNAGQAGTCHSVRARVLYSAMIGRYAHWIHHLSRVFVELSE